MGDCSLTVGNYATRNIPMSGNGLVILAPNTRRNMRGAFRYVRPSVVKCTCSKISVDFACYSESPEGKLCFVVRD